MTLIMSSSHLISLCFGLLFVFVSFQASHCTPQQIMHWPAGRSTRFYDFKVQKTKITKLCKSKEIITINGMFPGPTVYAEEDDCVIIRVTNETPHNATIHWHYKETVLSQCCTAADSLRQRSTIWYCFDWDLGLYCMD